MAAGNGVEPYSVAGKTAIVTGAGSGICLEFASLLLSQGCNVLVCDLALRPEAEQLYAKYIKGKPRAIFLKTDVTNWSDLSQAFTAAVEIFGDVDIVCPGAGVFEPDWSSFWHPPGVAGTLSKDDAEGFGHYGSFDVNITHPVRMTQLAISYFLNPAPGKQKASATNPKRVINIASIASELALLPKPLYCASKWAISGFTRSFDTLEAFCGVRINAVAPGCVYTPLWTTQPDKLSLLDESKDKWVSTEEVAQAMLKLLQDPDMPGGTVLEVGVDNTRPIPLFGNVPPQGPGHEISNMGMAFDQVHEKLQKAGWGVMPKSS